ncbi:MAG: hypothetical protein GX444_03845 [Myxococcales bacterium]|nr:hypothetical protein [Myxococcales bacterium]
MRKYLLAIVLVFGLLFSSILVADDDVMLFPLIYSVYECGTSPGILDLTSLFQGYIDEMEEYSWSVIELNDSSNNVKRTMSDCDLTSYGRDDVNLEPYDIALIAGHGQSSDFRGEGDEYRFQGNKLAGSNCYVYPRTTMSLGAASCGSSSDIDFFHLHSCYSMELTNQSYSHTWRPAFHGVHMISGYDGKVDFNMHQEYEIFAHNAQNDSVAYNWTDMWEDNVWCVRVGDDLFVCWDRCPVIYTSGTCNSDLTSRIENETYGNRQGFGHVLNPTYFKRLSIEGCAGY